MRLAPASFDLQLIKEDTFQYSKGQIASIKNKHALAEQSFHSALLVDEDLKHQDFATWRFQQLNRHLQKDSLRPG